MTAGSTSTQKPLGVKLKGGAQYSPDFLLPKREIGEVLAKTGHVVYLWGVEVEAAPGCEVLAISGVLAASLCVYRTVTLGPVPASHALCRRPYI